MITRAELKKKIPYRYGKKIAEKAGVSEVFVSKFLNNSEVNSLKVEIAALEVIAELEQQRNSLISKINFQPIEQ